MALLQWVHLLWCVPSAVLELWWPGLVLRPLRVSLLWRASV
jgi:hypothetical protein